MNKAVLIETNKKNKMVDDKGIAKLSKKSRKTILVLMHSDVIRRIKIRIINKRRYHHPPEETLKNVKKHFLPKFQGGRNKQLNVR